jgi:hypothetical protein
MAVSQKWDNGTVRRVPAADEKPLHWVGSAKRDFLSFPAVVKEDMGNALGIVQFGGTGPTVKPWKGLGPGVLELWSRTTETRIGPCTLSGSRRPCMFSTRFRKSRRLVSEPRGGMLISSPNG